jgi:hypothetical protein
MTKKPKPKTRTPRRAPRASTGIELESGFRDLTTELLTQDLRKFRIVIECTVPGGSDFDQKSLHAAVVETAEYLMDGSGGLSGTQVTLLTLAELTV